MWARAGVDWWGAVSLVDCPLDDNSIRDLTAEDKRVIFDPDEGGEEEVECMGGEGGACQGNCL